MTFHNFLRALSSYCLRKDVKKALALNRQGEARRDGLVLVSTSHCLDIEWRARAIHPWDRDRSKEEQDKLFLEQLYCDVDTALLRLFATFPDIDVIRFKASKVGSHEPLLEGEVKRLSEERRVVGLTPRTKLWRMGVRVSILLLACSIWALQPTFAQTPKSPTNPAQETSTTSTDLFVMMGSDFDRPGLVPRANYNIGIGHTFGFLKKDPIGDELTIGYTYENGGTHGWFHTDFGEHTEQLGVMKNFGLPHVKTVTGYTWIQTGLTSYTGYSHVLNRMASGASLGAVVHLSFHSSIWLQESYTKVVTVPWYTTSSVGYTYSW